MIKQIEFDLQNRYKHKNHRLQHVYNVVKTTLFYANKFQVDLNKAHIASLLHDITKYESNASHISLIQSSYEKHEEILNGYPPTIWHGFSAAAYAKKTYNINDEDILNAIKHHTVGRPNMNRLEEILFLADYIEPGRTYSSCHVVREVAKTNWHKAIFMAMDFSITYHEEKESFIPKIAYKAREYYRQKWED
jgi:nicotinate-nucleotide adenylyltransferase